MPVKNPRWPPRNLVFLATSDRGDFPRIIEIALYFYHPKHIAQISFQYINIPFIELTVGTDVVSRVILSVTTDTHVGITDVISVARIITLPVTD